VAGGKTGGEQSAAAASGTCRETAKGGGDPGHLRPIPSTGKLLGMWRSCSAGRGGRGRCGAARESGGHGGRT
jgi:hypothetical protein